jgi:hypothetical protein
MRESSTACHDDEPLIAVLKGEARPGCRVWGVRFRV